MEDVTIIGIDLAKRIFQLHGACADGSVAFKRRVSRSQLLPLLAKKPRAIVAMEACATAYDWGRKIAELGHDVRLIPPAYVRPFLKRQKNDAADAEAIVEAASRPTMRFVAVKTQEQQARAMLFRTRDLLVRQRTQLINALRGHLAEHGAIVPKGRVHLKRLIEVIGDEASELPAMVREIGAVYLDQITILQGKIAELDVKLRTAARNETTARMQTMPGVGPVTAMAVEAFAPPMESFRRGRDFAAWLGLVPKQHSTGGKQRLGKTSKMGQRDIRRLLIVGAMSVVRASGRKGAPDGSWLQKMLGKKPRLVVAIALANRMARQLWAMLVKDENFRDPAIHAA